MSHKVKGRLKIYFGYAPGVGKTYRMLADAQQLKALGADVAIASLAHTQSGGLVAVQTGIELISPAIPSDPNQSSLDLDVPAVLKRNPQICLIDELARTDIKGNNRSKRWMNVQLIRQAGIDVFTTLNVENLASLSDYVWSLTKLRIRETVPDWLFQDADDIVMVDVTPRALIHRLERGAVSAQGRIELEMYPQFQEATLDALRELAIRQTAQAIATRQAKSRMSPNVVAERIFVHVTPHPATATLLRRARRVADFLQANCIAAYVESAADRSSRTPAARIAAQRHLDYAKSLQFHTVRLEGEDPASALVDYCRREALT